MAPPPLSRDLFHLVQLLTPAPTLVYVCKAHKDFAQWIMENLLYWQRTAVPKPHHLYGMIWLDVMRTRIRSHSVVARMPPAVFEAYYKQLWLTHILMHSAVHLDEPAWMHEADALWPKRPTARKIVVLHIYATIPPGIWPHMSDCMVVRLHQMHYESRIFADSYNVGLMFEPTEAEARWIAAQPGKFRITMIERLHRSEVLLLLHPFMQESADVGVAFATDLPPLIMALEDRHLGKCTFYLQDEREYRHFLKHRAALFPREPRGEYWVKFETSYHRVGIS